MSGPSPPAPCLVRMFEGPEQTAQSCSLLLPAARHSWGRGVGTCRPWEHLESSYRDCKVDKQEEFLSFIFLSQDHRHNGDNQPGQSPPTTAPQLSPFKMPFSSQPQLEKAVPSLRCSFQHLPSPPRGVVSTPCPSLPNGSGTGLLLPTGWRLGLCPGRVPWGPQLAATSSPLQLQKEGPTCIPILQMSRRPPGEEAPLAPDHKPSQGQPHTPEGKPLSSAPKQAKERVRRREAGGSSSSSAAATPGEAGPPPTPRAPFPSSPWAQKPLLPDKANKAVAGKMAFATPGAG